MWCVQLYSALFYTSLWHDGESNDRTGLRHDDGTQQHGLCLQAGVESILCGNWLLISLPMEAMAGRKFHRSVKARGRFKGISHAKSKRNDVEREPASNHIDLSRKFNSWEDITNVLQKTAENGEIDGKYLDKYSTFSSSWEHEDFSIPNEAKIDYLQMVLFESFGKNSSSNPLAVKIVQI